MANVYATAQALIAKGIRVIPTTGKKPIVEKWRDVDITPALVEQWNAEGKWSGNIAVICGEQSGNLVIIDFDGMEGYEAFKAQFPDLLDTHTVKSGGGNGMHLYYRVDLLPSNTNAKDITSLNNSHIEIRAQNLLVTIPPSIHPKTNQPYTIVKDCKAKQVTDLARVVAWVKALNPVAHKEHPPGLRHDDNINPRVLDALRTHFQNQDKTTKRGDWINCSCPNPAHADKEASFGYNILTGAGNCFFCTNIKFNVKTLCEMVGIDVKALGGLFEQRATTGNLKGQLARPVVSNGTNPTPANPSPKPLPKSPIYMTGRQARQAMDSRIDGVTLAKHPPMPTPLNFLRRHGIRVFTPGRLAYLASVSGGGKTTMMELIVDRILQRGGDVIIRSDEWISEETAAQDMEMRRVQRYGGPTYQQIALHELWEHEEVLHLKHQNGQSGGMCIPREKREGIQFTPRQYDIYKRVRSKIDTWQGEAFYLLEQDVSVEKMKLNVEHTYLEAVHQGRKPVAFFLDYAQLVWLEQETKGKIWIEQAMTKTKAMCGNLGMVGFVFSQLNQDATDAVNNGKDFSPTMMNWLSERQANLVVMWLALKDEAGKYITEDRQEVNENTGVKSTVSMRTLHYQIVKNSFGQDGEKGFLDWNPARLRIEDAKETVQYNQKQLAGD